jgi:hypothetical protein
MERGEVLNQKVCWFFFCPFAFPNLTMLCGHSTVLKSPSPSCVQVTRCLCGDYNDREKPTLSCHLGSISKVKPHCWFPKHFEIQFKKKKYLQDSNKGSSTKHTEDQCPGVWVWDVSRSSPEHREEAGYWILPPGAATLGTYCLGRLNLGSEAHTRTYANVTQRYHGFLVSPAMYEWPHFFYAHMAYSPHHRKPGRWVVLTDEGRNGN